MDSQPQLPPPPGIIHGRTSGPVPVTFVETQGPAFGTPYTSDEMMQGPLIEYWRILRRRRGILILAAFLGALAGFLISLPQTPVYQARASVEIQNLNEDFLNIKQVNTLAEPSPAQALSDIDTQIKILQSDSLIEPTLGRLDLKQPRDLRPDAGRTAAWRNALDLPGSSSDKDDPLEVARRNLKVRQAGQTRIVEILYDSTDPKVAAQFANTLVNEYIDQNVESRWKMSQRTGDWLTRQLEDVRIRLQRSEDALQRYARKSGLLYTSEKNSVSEDKLRQLQEALSKAQADRIARQSRYEMADRSAPETLPDVLNDSSLREYQQKLAELRRQRAELRTTYAPEYSKVRKVEAQIASLETDLQRDRLAIIKRIRNEYDEALQREKLLAADYSEQTQLITQEAEKAIQYNILKREVDTNRQLYDAMLQRVKEANIASAMRASNVRIVDPAKAPKRPYKPRMPLNTGLGLLSGAFLGIAFILIRERADRSIQQPGDLAQYLNVPELGVIPSVSAEPGGLLPYGHWKRILGGRLHTATDNGQPQDRLELATFQRQPSLIAESFRAVLTSILFSARNGGAQSAFVITSASPCEGKSTVACNLAIALAGIHKRVLLIDGDLHKPRLHHIFDLNNACGLVDLLRNGELPSRALEDLIRQTAVPGLFLLPSGLSATATADLLHSGRMAELLSLLREQYDQVVIDSPPMLELPDARVLGRLAGGVILVVRVGQTTRDAALAAKRRLDDDGVPVIGTILNDWDPRSSPQGYYGSYKGYYKSYSKYYSRTEAPAAANGVRKHKALLEHLRQYRLPRAPKAKPPAGPRKSPQDVERTVNDIRKIVEDLSRIGKGIDETLNELGKLGQEDETIRATPPVRRGSSA